MRARAATGETLHIVSGAEHFTFKAVKPGTWQGALKGKARIKGNIFSTGLDWASSR